LTRDNESSEAEIPRPIRSLLFVPGNREDFMGKALASEADALVFDLESATPRAEIDRARACCRRVLDQHDGGRPSLFVRVSDARSPEQTSDLDAVVCPGLYGILLPQVIDTDDVVATDEALTRYERAAGLPVGGIRLMPLVETANAIRMAFEIASASPRVTYMGGATSRGGDLARSLGYRFTEEGRETLFLRSKVLVDVRAAGVANPISGLWGRIDDLEGLRGFAEQSRDLGYEGLMAIHPSQLPIINAVFSASESEIAEWQRIIAAMEQAQVDGRGAIRLDGRLIDAAHVQTAQDQLERAERLGLIVGLMDAPTEGAQPSL
jgi:citrate lyase subunit beta/citryl-CoA lyase